VHLPVQIGPSLRLVAVEEIDPRDKFSDIELIYFQLDDSDNEDSSAFQTSAIGGSGISRRPSGRSLGRGRTRSGTDSGDFPLRGCPHPRRRSVRLASPLTLRLVQALPRGRMRTLSTAGVSCAILCAPQGRCAVLNIHHHKRGCGRFKHSLSFSVQLAKAISPSRSLKEFRFRSEIN
jgi:hypothetical protein